MPFYQSFRTRDRDTYCSDKQVHNRIEGDAWVKACATHFSIRADQILKKEELQNQPPGAILWWPPTDD